MKDNVDSGTSHVSHLAERIKEIKNSIADEYRQQQDNRPWVIAFSGGKDSTVLLQMVWLAVLSVPAEERTRPMHLVCNDTRVENPVVAKYNNLVLKRLKRACEELQFPLTVTQTTPKLADSFWVNLLGKGYAAPNSSFRWCTPRLKIDPTTAFIKSKFDQGKGVVILLGTRSAESSSRARSLKDHQVSGSIYRKHSSLPEAVVYAPIEKLTTDEVWQYLSSVRPPWGGSHRELITLYSSASDKECPIIVDTSINVCGGSRFGCWVCTVIKSDKSMTALVDNGADWMEPLLEYRDLLVKHRSDPEWRMDVRRNGKPGIGPYRPEIRFQLLTKLLLVQNRVAEYMEGEQLITREELAAIDQQWKSDGFLDLHIVNAQIAASKS